LVDLDADAAVRVVEALRAQPHRRHFPRSDQT